MEYELREYDKYEIIIVCSVIGLIAIIIFLKISNLCVNL
jgi:hypothetical protein